MSKENRYEAYSAGFEAGKEAGRLAALQELGIDPNYKPELPRTNRYIVEESSFEHFTTGGDPIPLSEATQNDRILAFLRGGGTLTPKDALFKFGCFRLSARIFDLRQAGWPIHMTEIQVGPRTWVALFSMEKGAKQGSPRQPARQMELA